MKDDEFNVKTELNNQQPNRNQIEIKSKEKMPAGKRQKINFAEIK